MASPPVGERFRVIAAGASQSCGLRDVDGSVICWGKTDYGVAPSQIGFSAVTVGEYHACALRADSVAVCWGLNHYGQTDVPEQGRFTAIVAGGDHTCSVRSGDASVVCW